MPDPADTPERRAALGARIQWARELVEPNRYAFARKLQVNVTTIAKIEDGTRNPSIWLLWRICHALRIDLDYVTQGWLNGVDPELAQLLKKYHPQLRRRTRRDIERRDNPGSTPDRPTTRVP